MEIAGERRVVRKHDVIFLPPEVEHAISNTGLTDLVFLVITSPRMMARPPSFARIASEKTYFPPFLLKAV